MTDAQNFSGKAYTIREGESLIAWLRRGSEESGEVREKFKNTIYHLVRMSLRDRAFAGYDSFESPPTPEALRGALAEVQTWAVKISREAGLNEWAAELLAGAVQQAYETIANGPHVTALVVDRMSMLIDPSGLGSHDVVSNALITNPQAVADTSGQATRWARDAITAAKVAPGNPYDDDDEAIAAAILAKIRAEREGPAARAARA